MRTVRKKTRDTVYWGLDTSTVSEPVLTDAAVLLMPCSPGL
jgi:hypothetical protein